MAEKNSSAVQGTFIQAATAPTFTNFANLASEMQIEIWKHAIPAPRLILVSVREGDDDDIRFTTNASVPALLSTCHTSRKIILEVYSTCLQSVEKKIRIDGGNDVLVLFSQGGCSGFPYTYAFLP